MIVSKNERLRGNYAKRIYVRGAQMTKTMSKIGLEAGGQEAWRPGGHEAERLRGRDDDRERN